jgi:hypothetical protein
MKRAFKAGGPGGLAPWKKICPPSQGAGNNVILVLCDSNRPPNIYLGPQSYFPGAGAALRHKIRLGTSLSA